MKERVGFIGLGIMGRPMAMNLLKAGFPLVVWNRTPGRAEQVVAAGAILASSPREVALASDVVITMVSDTAAVEEVLLGPGGVIEGVHPGLVAIDMSTISPQATQGIAGRLKEAGIDMLDAPVSGGDIGAAQGTLTIMVGGEEAIYQRCLPVFQAMGQRVTHCGGHGAGQTVKLVNQIIVVGMIEAISEGFLFASASGVDLEKVYNAISAGSANSWILQSRGPMMMKREWQSGFTVKLQHKDVKLALEAADRLHLPLPGLALVSQLYAAVVAAGGGDLGNHALARALEMLSGVEIGQQHQADHKAKSASGACASACLKNADDADKPLTDAERSS